MKKVLELKVIVTGDCPYPKLSSPLTISTLAYNPSEKNDVACTFCFVLYLSFPTLDLRLYSLASHIDRCLHIT